MIPIVLGSFAFVICSVSIVLGLVKGYSLLQKRRQGFRDVEMLGSRPIRPLMNEEARFQAQLEKRLKCQYCDKKNKSFRCKECFQGICADCFTKTCTTGDKKCPGCRKLMLVEKVVMCRL